MIDYQARSQLAQAARALVAGRITNDEFENRQPESNDLAAREIFYRGFWPLYSDTREYRLTGKHKLAPQDREFAARCVVFLKSGLPYKWPVLSLSATIKLRFRNILTFGRASREYDQHLRAIGDVTLWPFQSTAQYAEARRSPVYLTGLGANNSFKPTPLRGAA
jgi:hypothetical protein